ncbi:MAG: OmpH family outer membrane protein [Planctomycetota bacterium]
MNHQNHGPRGSGPAREKDALASFARRAAGKAAWLVAAVALTASVVLALPRAGHAARPFADGAVATVNLEQLINSLDEFKDARENLATVAEERRAELQGLSSRVSDLRAEAELVPEDDEGAFRDVQARLIVATRELETRSQVFQELNNAEFAEAVRKLYPKVLGAIEEIADREGYEVVISNVLDDRLDARTPQEVVAQLSSQTLLYASAATDITEEVVVRMNNAFNAGG